jgi:hypothetical protein
VRLLPGTGVEPAARWATVAGLAVGALGVLVLRFSGQPMPPVPPGLVLLVGAAAVVAAVHRRWAPAVAVLVAGAEIAGFVLTGGLPDLLGAGSAAIVAGSWLRAVGIAVAAVAGVVATVAGRRVPVPGERS